jgi:hypothetical protein
MPKPFRLILIVKANKVDNHKDAAKEIDLGGDGWFTCGLSATGKEPAIYYMTQVAVGDTEALKYMKKVGNSNKPQDWEKKDRGQKKGWVQAELNKLGTGHGTFLVLNNSENYGEEVQKMLANAGMKIIPEIRNSSPVDFLP